MKFSSVFVVFMVGFCLISLTKGAADPCKNCDECKIVCKKHGPLVLKDLPIVSPLVCELLCLIGLFDAKEHSTKVTLYEKQFWKGDKLALFLIPGCCYCLDHKKLNFDKKTSSIKSHTHKHIELFTGVGCSGDRLEIVNGSKATLGKKFNNKIRSLRIKK